MFTKNKIRPIFLVRKPGDGFSFILQDMIRLDLESGKNVLTFAMDPGFFVDNFKQYKQFSCFDYYDFRLASAPSLEYQNIIEMLKTNVLYFEATGGLIAEGFLPRKTWSRILIESMFNKDDGILFKAQNKMVFHCHSCINSFVEKQLKKHGYLMY